MKNALIIVMLVTLAVSVASADYQYGNKSETRLSVFMVKDTQSDESGFGAALSKLDEKLTDISYMDFGEFTLTELTQLEPKEFGPYGVYFGFAVAYAKPDDGTVLDVPDGFVSGLALILGKVDLSYGLTLDLRASSLSKDFDPIAWFSDPDILILGAGLSHKF